MSGGVMNVVAPAEESKGAALVVVPADFGPNVIGNAGEEMAEDGNVPAFEMSGAMVNTEMAD